METITQYVRRNAGSFIGAGTAAAAALLLAAAMCLTAMAAPARDTADARSFDDAVRDLYGGSDSMSDEEVLASARAMCSDTDVLYSELEADTAAGVAAALSAYEASKAGYLTARINGTTCPAADPGWDREQPGAGSEWERQGRYARLMITGDAGIVEMIPRFAVRALRERDGTLELDIEEWMTMGYGAAAESGPVNASAYSYSFSLSMRKNAAGAWAPVQIGGTDINFAWLREDSGSVTESEEPPLPLYAVQSDLTGQAAAYARLGDGRRLFVVDGSGTGAALDGSAAGIVPESAIPDGTAGGLAPESAVLNGTTTAGTAPEGAGDAQQRAVSSGTYTYHASKAVSYADKYWKNYNKAYREYRGVDCANFVSQCLYAGGMPKTSDWYPASVNWINVTGHIRHFKSFGTFMTADNARVTKGNPVYYDWNGNGTYDHVGICVGTNASGMPVVDAHTNNVFHVPWQMGSRGKRATIVLRKSGTVAAAASGAPNTWQTVGGKIYFIGSDGQRVKNRFLTVNGLKYYLDSSGQRVTGFFRVGSKWYYASVKTGALLRGWQRIGGRTYYFLQDYSRITGGRHRIGSATYYFNSKGVRQTSFIRIGSKWYYADKTTGKFVKGWKKISGKWYYFDPRTMVRTVGWKTIKGKRCYFDSKGILRKGKHG